MKKTNILFLLLLSAISSASLTTSCFSKVSNSKPYLSNNYKNGYDFEFDNNKISKILQEVKSKLTADQLDGSVLDELLPFNSQIQKNKIIKLIKTTINNEKIIVELLDQCKTNLSQTANSVKVKIWYEYKSYIHENFTISFKNVKAYTKLQIDDLFSNIESKLAVPIDGAEFREGMWIDIYLNSFEKKISTKINDERIKVDVVCLMQTIKQTDYKVKFNISVDHPVFKNQSKQLTLKLINVQKDNQSNYSNYSNYDYSKSKSNYSNYSNYDYSKSKSNYSKSNDYWKNYSNHQNNKPETKMDKIQNSTFYELIGITYDWRKNISRIKKDYKTFQRYFHQDKKVYFFRFWYEKLKNKINCGFDALYTALSLKIFKIFKDEVQKVEKILASLDKYDEDKIYKNEVISNFYKDLTEVNACINSKRDEEEKKWNSL